MPAAPSLAPGPSECNALGSPGSRVGRAQDVYQGALLRPTRREGRGGSRAGRGSRQPACCWETKGPSELYVTVVGTSLQLRQCPHRGRQILPQRRSVSQLMSTLPPAFAQNSLSSALASFRLSLRSQCHSHSGFPNSQTWLAFLPRQMPPFLSPILVTLLARLHCVQSHVCVLPCSENSMKTQITSRVFTSDLQCWQIVHAR